MIVKTKYYKPYVFHLKLYTGLSLSPTSIRIVNVPDHYHLTINKPNRFDFKTVKVRNQVRDYNRRRR